MYLRKIDPTESPGKGKRGPIFSVALGRNTKSRNEFGNTIMVFLGRFMLLKWL